MTANPGAGSGPAVQGNLLTARRPNQTGQGPWALSPVERMGAGIKKLSGNACKLLPGGFRCIHCCSRVASLVHDDINASVL